MCSVPRDPRGLIHLYPLQNPLSWCQVPRGALGDLNKKGPTELEASKMADEALAGLDEGALRKLVSELSGHPERQGLSRVSLC